MYKHLLTTAIFEQVHNKLRSKIPYKFDPSCPVSSNHTVLLITVIASQRSRDQTTAKIKDQLINHSLDTPDRVKRSPELLNKVLTKSGGALRKVKSILQAFDKVFIGDFIDLSLLTNVPCYGIGLKTKAIVTACITGQKRIFVDINVLRAFRSFAKSKVDADSLHRFLEKEYPKNGPELTHMLWYYRKNYCERRHCDYKVQCSKCSKFWS